MIRAQRKESVASVLPTTLGQGNFLDVASTKKGRRPMTAPSSTSLVWSNRGKFDQTITCHREIISSRDKGGRQTLGHGAEKNGRDNPALQPGRVLALRTCPQQKKHSALPAECHCWVMVGTTGFEPATPASRTRCSTRLSHVPTLRKYNLSIFNRQV